MTNLKDILKCSGGSTSCLIKNLKNSHGISNPKDEVKQFISEYESPRQIDQNMQTTLVRQNPQSGLGRKQQILKKFKRPYI